MKRTRLNRVSKSPRRALELKADKLWSDYVRLRANGRCEVCLCAGDDPHHITGRWDKHRRHDPANGVFLCRKHHQWAHQFPHIYNVLFEDKAGRSPVVSRERGTVTQSMLKDTIKKLSGLIAATSS